MTKEEILQVANEVFDGARKPIKDKWTRNYGGITYGAYDQKDDKPAGVYMSFTFTFSKDVKSKTPEELKDELREMFEKMTDQYHSNFGQINLTYL